MSAGGEVSRPEPSGIERARTAAPGSRSAAEIRNDIQLQREELAGSVEALRGRVGELTNWRRQVSEHKRELAIGAAVLGFAVGGWLARRRR